MGIISDGKPYKCKYVKIEFSLQSGSIKVWDFGSGQLYKMFPEEQAKVKQEDTITGLAFCTIQNKRCLLVSAWGRKIRIMEVGDFDSS